MRLDLLLIRKKDCKSIITLAESVINSIKPSGSEGSFDYSDDTKTIHIEYNLRRNSSDSLEISFVSDITDSVENAIIFSQLREEVTSERNRKQLNIIVLYDDASNIFSYKLMPFFGEFERKLRKLVYITVVKALGNEWFSRTFTHEKKKFVKKRLVNKSPVENALEELDYMSLRQYLTQKKDPKVDIKILLETELSNENIRLLGKEEIIDKLQRAREYSLWEKLFNEYEDVSQLPELLEEIRDMRNRVMHQKTINENDYGGTKRRLINIISLLDKSINYAEMKMYTGHDKAEVARSLGDVYNSLFEPYLKIIKTMDFPNREITQKLQNDLTSKYKNILEGQEFPVTEWGKSYSSQIKAFDFATSSLIKTIGDSQKNVDSFSSLAEVIKKYHTISNNIASLYDDYKIPRLDGFDAVKDEDEDDEK